MAVAMVASKVADGARVSPDRDRPSSSNNNSNRRGRGRLNTRAADPQW